MARSWTRPHSHADVPRMETERLHADEAEKEGKNLELGPDGSANSDSEVQGFDSRPGGSGVEGPPRLRVCRIAGALASKVSEAFDVTKSKLGPVSFRPATL